MDINQSLSIFKQNWQSKERTLIEVNRELHMTWRKWDASMVLHLIDEANYYCAMYNYLKVEQLKYIPVCPN